MSDTWYRDTIDPAVADIVAALLGQIPPPADEWPVGPFGSLLWRPLWRWHKALSTERSTSREPLPPYSASELLDAILPDRLLPIIT